MRSTRSGSQVRDTKLFCRSIDRHRSRADRPSLFRAAARPSDRHWLSLFPGAHSCAGRPTRRISRDPLLAVSSVSTTASLLPLATSSSTNFKIVIARRIVSVYRCQSATAARAALRSSTTKISWLHRPGHATSTRSLLVAEASRSRFSAGSWLDRPPPSCPPAAASPRAPATAAAQPCWPCASVRYRTRRIWAYPEP